MVLEVQSMAGPKVNQFYY